jgi:hypothetical protein
MATKREEEVAWRKLQKRFPNKYIDLTHERTKYGCGAEKNIYKAYVDIEVNTFLSDSFFTPYEAVNDVITKIERSMSYEKE